MGFKEDADFARFVSMGAVGAAAVAGHLHNRHGHRPIELERYATANKVWQAKVKRLRLPDLVCTRCGIRVESRAKSRLGIVLSHSDIPGREWHAGGMRDQDLYAFLRADLSDFPPQTSSPAYFTTAALHDTVDRAKRSAPKAASEGSEVTLTWPTWVPSKSGTFEGVDREGRLTCTWDDGRTSSYWQWRNWQGPRFTYLSPGQVVYSNETILAGVVAPALELDCKGDVWDLESDLCSEQVVDVYAAIKTIGATDRDDLRQRLITLVKKGSTDWRVRVEAYASLARLEPETWTKLIEAFVLDQPQTLEQQMEAVFVLSEIPADEASASLAKVAMSADSVSSEVRAAAVWGLGQGSVSRPDLLLPMTLDPDRIVALHAITAIQELPDNLVPTLVDWLIGGDNHKGSIAAQLLQRHRKIAVLFDVCDLDSGARLWALRALGDLPAPTVRLAAGDRLTPEIKEILQPMWHGHDDWLRNEAGEGLEALDIQKVRHDPMKPWQDPGA